jgi:hypothetical protein
MPGLRRFKARRDSGWSLNAGTVRIVLIFHLLCAALLAVLAISNTILAQPKATAIEGDGMLRLCMPEEEFLQGPGKSFSQQPQWGDPQLRYTTVYARPDFWRGRDYLVQHSHAVGFLRAKLVAIIREASIEKGSPVGDKVEADLRRQLYATYNLPSREDKRFEVFGNEITWLTFVDGQGNRAQLEVHRTGGILNIFVPFPRGEVVYVRLSYYAAGFPPGPGVRPEQINACGSL